MKLTEKQQRFCDYYLSTFNATQSYKLAGYSANDDNIAGVEGHKLLRNPKISKFIEETIKEKKSERIATQDEVLELLTAVARGELREKKPIDLQTRVRAMELLGKAHGLFSEKLIEIHNANQQTDIQYIARWGDED